MKAKILQWGNSLALRIPKSMAQSMHVQKGTEVEMNMKVDALIIKKPHYDLQSLLENITSENFHSEVDTGHRSGHEIW